MVVLSKDAKVPLVPNVVVVDPHFQCYGPLVAAARAGRLNLHLRANASEAIKLARRLEIDAWLVSADLEDMAGEDFIELLDTLPTRGSHSVAMVASPEAGIASTGMLHHPVSADAVDALLRDASSQVAETTVTGRSRMRTLMTLPVGVGAALIAIAALMIR